MVLSTRLRAVRLKLESWLGCLSRKTQLRKYPQLSKAFPCLEVNTLVPKPCLGGEPNASREAAGETGRAARLVESLFS